MLIPSRVQVIASTFEKFVDELERFEDQLEVHEGEIGDTWIHGISSDPTKSKNYRAIQRMRSKCLLEESCTAQDPAFRNFTRLLLKIPEHTWGIDSKSAPGDWNIWDNAGMAEAMKTNPLWGVAADSWVRQNAYIGWAVEVRDTSVTTPGNSFILYIGSSLCHAGKI